MSLRTLLRAAVGRRLCGALPERESRPLRDFQGLGLPAYNPLGDALSLARFLPSEAPLDQLATGSCVSQAWCLGEVVTMAARHSLRVPLPSRRCAYYWGRFLDGAGVTDTGCRPSVLLRAVARYGLPPETAFPFSQARINQRPPLGARWDGQDHVGARDSYQVYETRLDDRVDAVLAALGTRRAFLLVLPVAAPFDNARDEEIIEYPKTDAIRGYHAVLGIGCSRAGVAEIVNSWGPGWGSNGRGFLAPEYLENSSSLIVIDPKEATR